MKQLIWILNSKLILEFSSLISIETAKPKNYTKDHASGTVFTVSQRLSKHEHVNNLKLRALYFRCLHDSGVNLNNTRKRGSNTLVSLLSEYASLVYHVRTQGMGHVAAGDFLIVDMV